jgi:ABC-type nitrate/sulfonate/bicarbonate transport system substrate-binding protein
MPKMHNGKLNGPSRRVLVQAMPALLGAMAFSSRAQAGDPPTDVALSLGSKSSAYGGVLIAEQLGLFAQHGLRVNLIISDSGNASVVALISGSVQFAGAGPEEGLTARGRKLDVVFVNNLYRGLSGSLILATNVAKGLGVDPGAPIGERLRALGTLIIASPSANSAYLVPIKTAAAKEGASPHYTYMTQSAMVAALRTGAIQGLLAASPFTDMSVSRGDGVVWISGPKGDLPPAVLPASSACLQTTERYIRANPGVVRRMQAVFHDLASIIQSQPAQARGALVKAYPDLDADLVDRMLAVNGANWTQPLLTPADIRHEIDIISADGRAEGLAGIDPASLLAAPS